MLRQPHLDHAADALRRRHLERSGVPSAAVVPWRSLQTSEQQLWRERAMNARPAQ